jgi:ribonuclease HI
MMSDQKITIYTDGGCIGNPGAGAWAYVLEADGVFIREASGYEAETTNNKMELTAVIEALKTAKTLGAKKITLYTDSQYVKNGITTWINKWKINGWRTANKAPVKNKEYWVALDELKNQVDVAFSWVKGHAGIPGNERCDALVGQTIEAHQ